MNFGELWPRRHSPNVCGMNKCLRRGFLLTEGHNLPTPLPVLHGCQALCEVLGDRLSSPWSPQESCACPATQLAVGFWALLFPYLCALQCLPICLCHGVTGKSCGNRKPSAAAVGPPRAPSVRRTGCLAWQGSQLSCSRILKETHCWLTSAGMSSHPQLW